MKHLKLASTGIVALFAVGLAACDSGDPTATGSTTPPAAQNDQTTTQAMPAPSGDQATTGEEKPAQTN